MAGPLTGRADQAAPQPPVALTVAGSDSGGAAGLAADLKTFAALGVYGTHAISVITAQNSLEVAAVRVLPAAFVAAQLDAVFADYRPLAVKTGYLGSAALVRAVAERLNHYRPAHIVIDPVLVNHRGQPMFGADVTAAYRRHLLPLANVLTPNLAEAALLLDRVTPAAEELEAIALALQRSGPAWVLLKGRRRAGAISDVLTNGHQAIRLVARAIETSNTHGSGDTLSSAACAYLARGATVPAAVTLAHAFTQRAIRRAAGWRMGEGHGPVAPGW